MNLVLENKEFLSTGIFGELRKENGELIGVTLQHAYPGMGSLGEEAWAPKLPVGTYSCVLGAHRLHSGPITTYEVTGVPSHTGILIHPGNTEEASEGCILIGTSRLDGSILESRKAFSRFMAILDGAESFSLVVK